jgi:hypothetical protein
MKLSVLAGDGALWPWRNIYLPVGRKHRDIGSAQLLWRRKKVAAVASQERAAIELCEDDARRSAIGSRNHTGRKRR